MSCDVGEWRKVWSSAHSPTFPSLHLRHSSFSNPSFASPTSQALHLIHQASRPWKEPLWRASIPGIYRSLHCIIASVYTVYCNDIHEDIAEMFWPWGRVWPQTWHSWRWISIAAILCAFKNLITDRTSQLTGAGIWATIFNRCNNATVRTPKVPLLYASCDVTTLSRTGSRFTQ